jgi:hypothetical protein
MRHALAPKAEGVAGSVVVVVVVVVVVEDAEDTELPYHLSKKANQAEKVLLLS